MTKPNAMTRAEAIESFRANEEIESVLVLLGKDEVAQKLRKVALLWAKIPLLEKGKERQFSPGESLWDDLWNDVSIDREEFKRVVGYECHFLLIKLRAYRLIYPDGTLAVAAQKALRQLAKNELGL